jgi:hypothetical protein
MAHIRILGHMCPPPHMTHVSSSSYDTCILLLIWHVYPPPHMTHIRIETREAQTADEHSFESACTPGN